MLICKDNKKFSESRKKKSTALNDLDSSKGITQNNIEK